MDIKKIILVDMDNVIADFNSTIFKEMRALFPGGDTEFTEAENNPATSFHVQKRLPEFAREKSLETILEGGFFRRLQIIGAAKKALNEMAEHADVFICTAPIIRNPSCLQDKCDWVKEFLGKEWCSRLMITKDKTLVRGDYLIDDNPEVKGIMSPQWEHIIFDQPYNKHIVDKKRLNWENWKEVLGL